ncbi:hypothetical protein THAOC_31970 [Thalassiosira oceanica]|uniref:Uncharacterized protein n=1 Tax=Thalassiosira oceanica TaxID=159749 RepID=K0RAD4_THAOC|nr:hypothetical protein THAOC_31970 [Thalassiosira oceanica]|eukprot:EJK49184.1 hypothetical protein THAOC_31970 [Thalassiosira oceanica]
MMGLKARNYSQHMLGRDNVVTDCLSRDFHLSDAQLITMLTSIDDSLSPDMLKIVQVPDDLISWISKLERFAPDRLESPKAPIPSALAAGLSGWSSSSGSNTTMTFSWTDSAAPDDTRSAVASIGKETLGFTSNEAGTHSVRSSLAMLMYLAKEPVYTIMLVGRWSSNVFLKTTSRNRSRNPPAESARG